MAQAVSQIGSQDAGSDLEEGARRTQWQLEEVLGELARGLNDFEARLQGAPVLDGLLEVGSFVCVAECLFYHSLHH